MEQDYWSDALKGWRKVAPQESSSPVFANMAICYEKLGKYHKALEFYMRAVRYAPKESFYRKERDRVSRVLELNKYLREIESGN